MGLSDAIARDLQDQPYDTAATELYECHASRICVSASVRIYRTAHFKRDAGTV
jgi:hypothetical protein